MDKLQTPEEFAEDFREWMVSNAQWPMLGDRYATKKLEAMIRARDAAVRAPLIEALEAISPLAVAWMGSYGAQYNCPKGHPAHQKIIAKAISALEAAKEVLDER